MVRNFKFRSPLLFNYCSEPVKCPLTAVIGWTVFHSSKVGHVTLLSQRGRAMLCICQQFASVVQYVERNLPLLVTSASDLPMRTNKFCSVPFSSSWSSVVVINKIHWCVAVCAVNCTVHRRSYCRHGRGSIFCDPTQPNPVDNGPNPTQPNPWNKPAEQPN